MVNKLEVKMYWLKDFIDGKKQAIVFDKEEAKLIYEMYLEYLKLKGEKDENNN